MSAPYLDHFGLRQAPFGITPNPALFHNSPGHQSVLDWIEDGIVARAPILSLTGAVGTGKSTLLRLVLDKRGSQWVIGLVTAFHSRPNTILVRARHALGLPDQGDSPALLSAQIRRFAEVTRANGGFTVLMVDDAQALTVESLSALASLAIDSGEGSALTLLLAGRPELRTLLAAPRLRSLRVSGSPRAVLAPFSIGDTADLVAHRLAQSGARTRIFDAGALQMLHSFSQGVPRLINIMAEQCLRSAAAEGVSQLDAARVRAVLEEAATTGAPVDPGWQAAGPPQPAMPSDPGMPGPQVLDRPQHPAASAGAEILHAAPRPNLTVPDPAPTPAAAAQGASASADPNGTPQARRATPDGRERRGPPGQGSGAHRAAPSLQFPSPVTTAPAQAPCPPVRSAPPSQPRAPGRPSGPWLSAAAAILAGGAAFVWFQPERASAPAIPDPARPSASASGDQAAATPAPSQPARSPAAREPTLAVLQPVAITPEPTVTALMKHALEVEADDPAQGAVAYARAAVRGSARAAYYLGQLYETGAGVEPSPTLARLWYAAATDLPAAQRRLQALPAAGAPAEKLATPVPLFQARLSNGGSEMIWRLQDGVAPVRFRVEAFGPAGEALPARDTTVPGLIVPSPVSAWRVIAIGADRTESAPSALVRMIPAGE